MLKRIVCFSVILFVPSLTVVSSCLAFSITGYPSESLSTPESVLTVVFCGLNYSSRQEYIKDVMVSVDRLRKSAPFDAFAAKIKVFVAELSSEEQQAVFKRTQGFPPLKVRNDFLTLIAGKVGARFKLVMLDAQGSTSCAELSEIDSISLVILGRARYTDSASLAKGFLHEIGHSLGLRDECFDCSRFSDAGPPNCAGSKEEAERWWGDLVGQDGSVNYIAGCCGNKNFVRATVASVMNNPDKAGDFGPVNERFLCSVLSAQAEGQ